MVTVYLAIFGLLGVFSRYYIVRFSHKYFTYAFPIDIFTINILGGFIIGIVYVLAIEKSQLSQELQIGLMVGFLGGFTTFSSYCLDTFKLYSTGKLLQSLLYFSLSPILGMLFTFLGIYLARKFL